MIISELQTYFKSQQVSLQWFPFLRALASELGALTDAEGVKTLMAGVGRHLADDASNYFQHAKTLSELEKGLNEFWAQINWGWVHFKEEDGHVGVVHFAAPLAEAFGDTALIWSPSVLAGFYGHVFGALGAQKSLSIRFVGEEAGGMCLRYEFGE